MENKLNIARQATEAITKKYSFVNDLKFHVYNHGVIEGGFQWMPYLGDYSNMTPVYDIFIRINELEEVTEEAIFNAIENRIIKLLEQSKSSDLAYEEEFNKPVKYRYDYDKAGIGEIKKFQISTKNKQGVTHFIVWGKDNEDALSKYTNDNEREVLGIYEVEKGGFVVLDSKEVPEHLFYKDGNTKKAFISVNGKQEIIEKPI